jgi:hypothetical protein
MIKSTSITTLAIVYHKMLQAKTDILIVEDEIKSLDITYTIGTLVNYDKLSFDLKHETKDLTEAIKVYNNL